MIGVLFLILGCTFYYLNQKILITGQELQLTKDELSLLSQRLDKFVMEKEVYVPTSKEVLVTGFNILDMLSAGCRGKISAKREKQHRDLSNLALNPEIESFEEIVISSFDQNNNSITFKSIKSNPSATNDRLEQSFLNYVRIGRADIRELPIINLGKKYDVVYVRSGGTVEREEVKFHYDVTMNKSKQLVIDFNHSVDRVFNYRPIKEFILLKFNCVGPTLNELDRSVMENKKG